MTEIKTGSNYKKRLFTGENTSKLAFPLGGIGAGNICLEGRGEISHVSIRGKPDVYNEPLMFAAVSVKKAGGQPVAKVVEGAVPGWKIMFPWGKERPESAAGAPHKSYGLPRFTKCTFSSAFPFGYIDLQDKDIPLDVRITGWSPFIPGDPDMSSLPFAALEYSLTNRSNKKIDGVFSFHSQNFMIVNKAVQDITQVNSKADNRVDEIEGGFILRQDGREDSPWDEGSFCVRTDDKNAKVNCRWFRSAWFDPITLVWKSIKNGEAVSAKPYTEGSSSPGGSLYVPFSLKPGSEKTVRLMISWHVPFTDVSAGKTTSTASCQCEKLTSDNNYSPWYSAFFKNARESSGYWMENYRKLKKETQKFTDAFYGTTQHPDIVEAIAANLSILKSPTVLRQTDRRLWCWEGCCDCIGCCYGSCTHVWNYAQAIPHLFSELERSLRQTEFNENQDERGHQNFRALLPISPASHNFHAAADGQLGGIMKVYRDWRISGDSAWLRVIWPKVKKSLEYCIETWDPCHKGIVEEPHHNTYDIEFWGPDGMCTSFYLGALKAASLMEDFLGGNSALYSELYTKGRKYIETELWNGEYFIQKVQWKNLKAEDPLKMYDYSAEARKLLEKEGPKYQYGEGCLSDGILGAWMAKVCGLGEIIDPKKVEKHLMSVFRYNFRADLTNHDNPQRSTYAIGNEGGLLLCSWPKGGELSLPFVYSNEVWTGIEYQIASHLASYGRTEQAMKIVRACRKRYDGRIRNPYNEYECGHWYGRALASYALLQGLTGIRYDAVEKILYIKSSGRKDTSVFLAVATGYGIAGIKAGKPYFRTVDGKIEIRKIIME